MSDRDHLDCSLNQMETGSYKKPNELVKHVSVATPASKEHRSQSGRIPAFDGLRAFAVLFVVIGHSVENLSSFRSVPAILSATIGNSSFGVRLFFVLSGFLITMLLCKEREKTGRVSIRDFYIRRSLRIFPAIAVYLATIFLLTRLNYLAISNSHFLAATTFTWNYSGAWISDGTVHGNWFLGHLWTLSLEEQFYLAWPFCFLLIPSSRLSLFAVAIIVLMPIIRIGTYFAIPTWRGYLGMMFHTAIDSIVVGCLFALIQPRFASIALRCRDNRWLSIMWWAAVLIPLLLSPLLRLQLAGNYTITVGFTIDAICAGIVISCLFNDVAPRSVTRFLCIPAIRWLGRLSYSLYLWQQLFLTDLNQTVSGTVPLCFACAIGAACLSYYFIEIPILRLKHRFNQAVLLPAE